MEMRCNNEENNGLCPDVKINTCKFFLVLFTQNKVNNEYLIVLEILAKCYFSAVECFIILITLN